MLSRWPFARLKAAQRALYNGRIDEAYDAAIQPDLRQMRGAQKLYDELARPLLARARLHAEAGRYRQVLDDIGRLETLGRANGQAQELRRRALDALKDRRERNVEAEQASAEAEADLRAGRLESGRAAIERIDDTVRREELREELDIRVERSEQIIERAAAVLDAGDVAGACRLWHEACARHGRSRASDELAGRIVPALRRELDDALAHGRLTTFEALMSATGLLRESNAGMDGHERVGELIAKAAGRLNARDYAGLRETLLRLRAMRGDDAWLKDALKSAGQVIDAHEELLASPLGVLAPLSQAAAPERKNAGETLTRVGRPAAVDESAAALGGSPLLMLVDGTGSCLLLTMDKVRIGRAGGGVAIDVPIPADILSHHADVVREGDDYFLVAHGPVTVNRRAAKRVLLRDGDRVVLGGSAKFVFGKPSAKSESAVLKVSDRCRLPQDVSHVVLLADTCLLGPQASSHLRTREGDSRLVLFDRAGHLYARQTQRAGPAAQAEPVRLNETHDYGDVRITLKVYEPVSGGRIA